MNLENIRKVKKQEIVTLTYRKKKKKNQSTETDSEIMAEVAGRL